MPLFNLNYGWKSRGPAPIIRHDTTIASSSHRQGILAFRAITTLLSMVQKHPPEFDDGSLSQANTEQRRELRILNALATVMVMDMEVFAVMAKDIDNSGLLRVITSQQHGNNETDTSSSRSFMDLYRFFVNKNPRPDSPVDNVRPVLIDPTPPEYFSKLYQDLQADPERLRPQLIEYASKQLSNSEKFSSESEHVWILTKLLVPPTSEGRKNYARDFLCYVVAASHKKIFHRLNHQTLSMPYYTSLREVKAFQFEELAEKPEPKPVELQNDAVLLRTLPGLNLRAEILRLLEQAALYTEDTFLEFHELLLELLSTFYLALRQLCCTNSSGSGRESKPRDHLLVVVAYGYALQRMVKGSGISHYLQNIEPSLTDHRPEDSNMASEDHDVDLEAVQPGNLKQNDGKQQPLWMSYLAWLRLILVHFDSVDILVDFVTGRFFQAKAVSIQILSMPNVDRSMLPWKDVLNDQDTVNFLDAGISCRPAEILVRIKGIRTIGKKFSQGTGGRWGLLSAAVDQLKDLISPPPPPQPQSESPSPFSPVQLVWESYVNQLSAIVMELNPARNKSSTSRDTLITRLDEILGPLQDTVGFFNDLKNWNTEGFKGSLHCEASLASLFMLPQDSLSQLGDHLDGLEKTDESLESQNDAVQLVSILSNS